MEKMGIPTVTVCTDAFMSLAREESKNLGMPELRIVVVKHPLGGEPKDGVLQRGQVALEQVLHGLTHEV
jgi:hypothetical protein